MARRLRAHSLDSQKEDSGMDHPTTSAQNGGRATSLSNTESRQADEAAAVPLAPAARAVGREAGPRSPSGSRTSPSLGALGRTPWHHSWNRPFPCAYRHVWKTKANGRRLPLIFSLPLHLLSPFYAAPLYRKHTLKCSLLKSLHV